MYGPDLSSTTNRLELLQDYKFVLNGKVIESLRFNNKIAAPIVPAKLRVDGEYNKNHIKYALEALFGKNSLASNLDAKLNGKSVGDHDVEFDAKVNTYSIKANGRREIIADNKSKLTYKLLTSFGTEFDVNGVVGNHWTAQNTDISLDAKLIAAQKQEPIK